MDDLIEKIEFTINKIRPYIQRDGGDVEFIKFEDGIVSLKFHGACVGCMALDSTLYDGIEAILMDEVPEVKGVKLEEDIYF